MIEKRWRFTNSDRPGEFIIVHDEVSARTLGLLLERTSKEKWLVGEEASLKEVKTPEPEQAPVQDRRGRDRRMQRRFPAAFRVILVAGKSSFRTTSVDISAGGMLLKDRLPDGFLNQKCVAYISSTDSRESLEMVCEIVGDKNDRRRICFKSVEAPSLKRLGEWLEDRIAA